MTAVRIPENKIKRKQIFHAWHTPGFTLVELIVVITILAVLATVGILTLSDYLSSSRDSSRITEIGQISRSVELSAVQNGKYPMPVASEALSLVSFTG